VEAPKNRKSKRTTLLKGCGKSLRKKGSVNEDQLKRKGRQEGRRMGGLTHKVIMERGKRSV